MKICLIDVTPSHYRYEIFSLMNKEFDIEFYFGDIMPSIKSLDLDKLLGFKGIIPIKKMGRLYRYVGLQSLLKAEYSHYILDGDFRCLSSWRFLLHAYFIKNKKTYVWTHAWYGRENLIKRLVKKFFFKLTDGIFVYGDYAKNLMIKEGFNPSKLFVVHNSLAYDQQLKIRKRLAPSNIYKNYFNNDDPNLIFIGRLTPVKKLDMILYAINILKMRNVNCNMTYIGDGTEKSELIKLVESLDLKDKVRFYGACYDETINAELIYNADLCISPGNIGLTAIHAMTFGTPVITHNNFPNQMPEFEIIKPNITGCFYEYGNVESLAETIKDWLESHTDRDAVRKYCYKEIDENWNPHFQLKVFKQVFN